MKHSLQLKLSQHLTLTPQLQQSIRLLQLSTLELNQELEQFLQENPLLERIDDESEGVSLPGSTNSSAPEASDDSPGGEDRESHEAELSAADWHESAYGSGAEDNDESDFPQATGETRLRDHLLWQINLSQLCDRDRELVRLLVDALDDDGYFLQDLDELFAMLPVELEIDPDELRIALRHLQNLDPTGVGARDLGECLSLQLEGMPDDAPARDLALAIVRTHIKSLAARDYATIKRELHCTDIQLREAQSLIQSLNPRPGAVFAPVDTRYVVPDVIVKKVKGVWMASLNPDAMPKLRINRLYADILSRHRDSRHGELASQLQEAKWLIKNVQQRFETILRVTQAIVDRQRHFFEHGEVAMRPLVLREIAETVDLHESTISRVTTQKYMMSPRGIYELKYFFGSHVSTDTGGTCSSTAIRALIRQLTTAENPKSPLSDSQIADLLGQQGVKVARRTIAKYRESLAIPPVNQRKAL